MILLFHNNKAYSVDQSSGKVFAARNEKNVSVFVKHMTSNIPYIYENTTFVKQMLEVFENISNNC